MSNVILKPKRNVVNEFINNFTSEHTRAAYLHDVQDFLSFFNGSVNHPEQLNLQHFIDYRDFLINNKRTTATINRKLSSIKSLMTWCAANGVIAHNPATNLKLPKVNIHTPTLAFTDDEVKKMLESPDDSTFSGVSHKLILAFLFFFGLRRSELINIKLEDIYEDRGVTILKVKGKGGKERFLPFTPELLVYFNAYKYTYSLHSGTKLNSDDFLLQTSTSSKSSKPINPSTIFRIVTRYARQCGIDRRVSPHSCRATVISHLLENQISPRHVADFAGHSNIQTTIGIYDKKRDGITNSAAYKVKYGN